MGAGLSRICRSIRRLAALAWAMLVSAAAFGRARNRRDVAARARWLQISCRRSLHALGVARVTTGRPPPGTLIAANHLGYLDILVLAAATPAVFVAKREVRTWPVFGWFARAAGTRFIDREKRADVARVAADLAPVLAAGVSVVLFLEGTSTDGRTVLPFKSSLLAPAARCDWSVTPAALAYRVPLGHSAADDVAWWGDAMLAPHLWKLASIPQIEARLAWGNSLRRNDRKTLATDLHRACLDLLGQHTHDNVVQFAAAADAGTG